MGQTPHAVIIYSFSSEPSIAQKLQGDPVGEFMRIASVFASGLMIAMALPALAQNAAPAAPTARVAGTLLKPLALVTNAQAFAGPPAVFALHQAGFQVAAHDPAFASAEARASYRDAHPGVVALAEQEPAAVVQAAHDISGRLDVLVSNDAYPPIQGTIETSSVDGLRDTLDRLVIFPFEIARAAVPHLRNQAKARVVFISSNRNRLPVRGGSIPDIARAAANALVRSLSIELAPHGVPVNAIAPNYLYSETYYPRSRFVDDAAGRAYVAQVVPAGRLGQPEEIGELIRYLATMDGTFLTGAVIDFSGGWPVATPFPQ